MFLKNYILLLSFLTTSCCAMSYNATTQQCTQENFIDAIKTGNFQKCTECIQAGIPLNEPILGDMMPLHLAAKYSEPKICDLLITNGAFIEAKILDGSTPLHLAAKKANLATYKMLMRYYANIFAIDNNESTPLHIAAAYENYKTCNALCREYIKRNKEAEINKKNKFQENPLTLAIKTGSLTTYEMLIKHGADIMTINDAGETLLHVAAQYNRKTICEQLLALQIPIESRTHAGMTPLHIAAQYGSVNVLNMLIKHNASINAQDQRNYQPLHFAAMAGHANICKILIQQGANPNAMTMTGNTALHLAANTGNSKTFLTLLELGAHKHKKNNTGITPFIIATHKKLITKKEISSFLKSTQIKTTHATHQQNYNVLPINTNPLHADIYNNDLTSFLLHSITNPTLILEKNEFNQNALDIAIDACNTLKAMPNLSPDAIKKYDDLKTMISVLAYSMNIDIPEI